ncbi:hypothetical protein GCM10029964_121120 [Kibdelosporangium lantanae]
MSARDWIDKDFYRELGVSSSATDADIKKSYRKLARELHPDANPGNAEAETRFKAVSEAYGVLGDPEKRKQYDEARRLFGSGGLRGFGGGNFDVGDLFGNAGQGGGAAGGGFSGLGDILGGLFGRRGQGSAAGRPAAAPTWRPRSGSTSWKRSRARQCHCGCPARPRAAPAPAPARGRGRPPDVPDMQRSRPDQPQPGGVRVLRAVP